MVQARWCPPHFHQAVRDLLNEQYPNRWISRVEPVAWPPRSLDLNSMNFYLWGHLKLLVYELPIGVEDVLRQRLMESCDKIPNSWNISTDTLKYDSMCPSVYSI